MRTAIQEGDMKKAITALNEIDPSVRWRWRVLDLGRECGIILQSEEVAADRNDQAE